MPESCSIKHIGACMISFKQLINNFMIEFLSDPKQIKSTVTKESKGDLEILTVLNNALNPEKYNKSFSLQVSIPE